MSQRNRSLVARLSAALVIVGLAGISAAAVWRSTSPVPAAAGSGDCGRLSIEPAEVTLTVDESRGDRMFSFTLRNDGSCPVNIVDVRTTCGCTIAALPEQRTLQQGEQTSLRISAHVPKLGERSVRITVATDSAAHPTVTATALLKGGEPETPHLFNSPHDLDIVGVRTSKFTRPVVLIATEQAAAAPWLTAIETDADWLRAAPPVIEAHADAVPGIVRRSYRFEISGELPDEVAGSRRATLNVIGADGSVATSFNAATRAVPAVLALPAAVYLTSSADNRMLSQTLVVRGIEPEQALEIEVVPPEESWLEIERADSDTGKNVQSLTCVVHPNRIPNETSSEIVSSAIELRTNHPDCATVTIPVHVRIVR